MGALQDGRWVMFGALALAGALAGTATGCNGSAGPQGGGATGGSSAGATGGSRAGATGGSSAGATGGARGSGGTPDGGSDSGPSGVGGARATDGGAGRTGATDAGGDADGGASRSPVLTVSGRQLIDTCGNPLIIRGIEIPFGFGFEVGGNFTNMIDEVAKTGTNSIRLLPDLGQLNLAALDVIFARAVQNRLVMYLAPGDRTWFGRTDVKALLAKYEAWIILDTLQEQTYDDPVRWLADARAAVAQVRGYGYRVPLMVITNRFGRDLPTALSQGGQVVASDPLGNTLIGWQAYWGSSNFYQGLYGMTLHQAMVAVAAATFPIQVGLDYLTDGTNEFMAYGPVMTDAQASGVGWMWWDWRLLINDPNTLSTDGTAAHLTTIGTDVITTQPAAISKTSIKACSFIGP